MRIHACLSWFDENPDHLHALVTSLHHAGIDHLIAIDGPYALYQHTNPRSSLAEYEALHSTPLPVSVYTPAQPWGGNELEKRNTLYRKAHAHANQGVDWLLVIDADMTITQAPDLHTHLDHAEQDVAEVTLYGDGNTRQHRALFRTQPQGIHVRHHHANYQTQDGVTLWNPCRPNLEAPALSLPNVRIDHHPHHRTPDRNQARLTYYDQARDHHIETLP